MKRELGVFATDQVDRHGTCISASELMKAEERARHAAREKGFQPGNPMHFQHDLHRLIGWSQVLGHLIDGAMVRTIGLLNEVETDEEKTELAKLAADFWHRHHHDGKEALRDELSERVAPASLEGATYHRLESYSVARPGLAAELYPDLFDYASELVDKDGLTDYRALVTRMKPLQPGIFLDEERGLVLFAHRFFRRSLSHRNKLNDYFLSSFETSAKESNLKPRLRLDPDLVGHAQTTYDLMEREYWHGPKFSDDVVSIPPGSSEYKASERTRQFEGIDRTHFWWKKPEVRAQYDTEVKFRTFEVEELIENASDGLVDERYGCRYAHAEFSPAVSAITHFDGAIRAYPAEAYLERIEKSIEHAEGKQAEYTKLFRFDGSLPVQRWKRLLSDFFRGNPLIPEYLGGGGREFEDENDSMAPVNIESTHEQNSLGEEFCAFVSLDHKVVDQALVVHTQLARIGDGTEIQAAETGGGAIDAFLRSKVDMTNVATLCAVDGVFHLARISFGATETLLEGMRMIIDGLADGLVKDSADFDLRKISLTLSWPVDMLNVTLSLRGSPKDTEAILRGLLTMIAPLKPPSTWIETLSVAIRCLSPRQTPTNNLWNVLEGTLMYQRPNEVERMLLLTPQLVAQLQADVVAY